MKLGKILHSLIALAVLCFASSIQAQSCEEAYKPAQNELQRMQEVLSSITTLDEYRDEVKFRYDKVEVLLFMATACSQNNSLSEEELQAWNLMMRALTTLQASAKASAFTKFSDWREARQADLNACLMANKI